ncbi:MAG: TldD/PmbA family protein, partial [Candidatus Aenigmarchaeota archaeon]|nr:TldD/PmbA family protein [Candidatus Aenigmarchaeota archaeon]
DKKAYSNWLNEKMHLVSAFVEPKKIRTGKYDILLSPKVFGSLLLDTVGFWASGKARLDGIGAFKEQGERVASESFSASVDGRLDNAMASFSVDAEGNKTAKKQVVEKGIFKDYFYDQRYASYFNESSNGCALRTSALGPEKLYTSSPYCGAHNLVIEPGKEKLENILSDMKGIFVENAGIATADPETGTFGFELRNAFIVDKGVLTPARYAVFSGTVQDLLKNVVLTKETQQVSEDGGAEFSSACVCAHALVGGQNLAGASNVGVKRSRE